MAMTTIPRPRSIEALGVRRSFLEDLAMKTLYLAGELGENELAGHMGINLGIVSELVQRLRKQLLCEAIGLDSIAAYTSASPPRRRGSRTPWNYWPKTSTSAPRPFRSMTTSAKFTPRVCAL